MHCQSAATTKRRGRIKEVLKEVLVVVAENESSEGLRIIKSFEDDYITFLGTHIDEIKYIASKYTPYLIVVWNRACDMDLLASVLHFFPRTPKILVHKKPLRSVVSGPCIHDFRDKNYKPENVRDLVEKVLAN